MLNTLILCPSARLARSIQNDITRRQLQAGQQQWQSAPVLTLSQWLDNVIEEALLSGEIAELHALLSPFNEQLLWEEVITQSLQKNDFGDLFDVTGLASAAIEANRYMVAWKLHVPREHQAEESRQFMQWRRAFQQRCSQLNALESVRYMDWQLDCLARNAGLLPARIEFAGFDQTAPQEQRLREILMKHGVQVTEYVTTHAEPAQTQHVNLENQEAECRAAVAWVKQRLDENPNAKLAIITPLLNETRNQLADLLDDVFYPASVRPGLAESARCYNFSLGTPLAQQPIIQAALNMLRLVSSYQLQQTNVSGMLLSPFWSASQQETDARALLDAKIREHLPAQFTWANLIAFARNQHEKGLGIPRLLADIQAANSLIPNRKSAASQWVQTLSVLLDALNWPGERAITSLEHQAVNAWQKALQQLGKLDVLGKSFSLSEAVRVMQQICTEQVFQAETLDEPAIQILGMMEALSAPVDAMWVMGMNDHIWPPAARPNPLLPAFIQRAAMLPNADNSVQAAFAATVQQRLLHSAGHIIFSSSQTENNSQLRASPLMKDIAPLETMPLAETLAEKLSRLGNQDLVHVEDHLAPAVQAGEHVSGGTGLFRAQAICPAWAFYQYRLGAKALKTPSNGLDAMARGILVHAVLAAFWQKRHFADLRDMRADDLSQALIQAIQQALQDFSAEQNIVSSGLLELEQERLYKLIDAWLLFEKERGTAFNIVACEAEKKVMICGIEVTLKIDRIHQLEHGGIEFIDYKTGQKPDINSWGEARIIEPQLPIYAAFYSEDASHVIGVQFGMVKIAEHAFSGVSETDFEAEIEKRRPKFIQNFTHWQELLTHWKVSIEAMAQEIKSGEASIKFKDEKDLMYCEVVPLLRLPERKLQFERFRTLDVKTDESSGA
ncbi:MAG TPA: PD-(D/E)XK nuclease family protein [Methylotenera sp.]|nr:PD-(D/E)XK nuclease family protein [Methylotenera sp.]HPV43885.1 PD-(D/E)XK nuclease family protein [Methylotenera sp.]